jgi:hypothetical protein
MTIKTELYEQKIFLSSFVFKNTCIQKDLIKWLSKNFKNSYTVGAV